MSSIPQSKEELLCAIQFIFPKLMDDYYAIPINKTRLSEIEGNIKGTKISVCDTVAYLIGWGKLVIKWHERAESGLDVHFPEDGYSWNQLGELASQFHQQYQDWPYQELLEEFDKTTHQVIELVESRDNETLYGIAWYKQWTLGRMIQFNTSSPMKNMRTKVRRFKKVHC